MKTLKNEIVEAMRKASDTARKYAKQYDEFTLSYHEYINFKQWLKYTIKVLLTPSCWIRNNQTSNIWDKQLQKLLEENKWRNPDRYTAYLDNNEIWISNHPYASFSSCKPVKLNVLPSRKTALYAMDRLEHDLLGGS